MATGVVAPIGLALVAGCAVGLVDMATTATYQGIRYVRLTGVNPEE